MYSEKTFKNYIFWVQVKRVFLIILFSCIGAALGVLIGGILKNTMQTSEHNNMIIIVSTVIFFAISILLTSGTGKEVQDGYWKIAVLRKLTVIQKDLEINNELMAKANKPLKEIKLDNVLDMKPSNNKKPKKFNTSKSEEPKKEYKLEENKAEEITEEEVAK